MAKECWPSTGKLPMGGLPRNHVVRLTYCPDMTSAFNHGSKANMNLTEKLCLVSNQV